MPKVLVSLIALLCSGVLLLGCATSSAKPSVDVPAPTSMGSAQSLPSTSPLVAPSDNIPQLTATPVASFPTLVPVPTPATLPMPTPTPLAQEETPIPEAEVVEPIFLEILSPIDGSGVELPATKVIGLTSASSVDINGVPVALGQDGLFQRDLPLREGVNLLEVVAGTPSGRTRSEQIVVFVVSPIAALPFSLIYPMDGVQVDSQTIPVVGVTRPDTVVGVNGVPVEVNELGIFSTLVELNPGDNLIEVVATDIREVRFQTIVVFRNP